MKCTDCGIQIIGRVYTRAIFSVYGKIVQNVCGSCYMSVSNRYNFKFSGWKTFGEEMPKATLSYEALTSDQDGNVTEGAYRLKLEGNFKQHIEPIVIFIKASIPSSDRTYDPNTYEWFYHEKYHDLMKHALSGSRFTLSYTITKEQFTELKRKQDEWAKQAGQTFQTKNYDTDNDIIKFAAFLAEASEGAFGSIEEVKNLSKETATNFWKKALRFFHPDLHPERAAQASELNEVWTRLKEGYYIK
jgi:hypothetical protein